MKIVYDATSRLLRSADVKNYHCELLQRLLPVVAPHTSELFPFLSEIAANRNEESNYSRWATGLRLGALVASNYFEMAGGNWAT